MSIRISKVSLRLTSCVLAGLSLLAQAHAYDVVAVKNGGQVRGIVRLEGAPPPEEHTLISKDNHVCGDGHALMNPVTIDASDGLANAVVRLEGVTAGKSWPTEQPLEIVQEKCAFWPYVQVVPKISELTIINKDPLLHNIHTYEIIGRARRTLFNIAQPSAGQIDTRALKLRRGDVVQVACDAHNWMMAWVYTSDSPYVSVTSADGSFSIDNIPPGHYNLKVWHPILGETSHEIAIKAGGEAKVELALASADN